MTAFVTRPSAVEGQGYRVNLIVAAITDATLDHATVVVGLFELQNLSHRDHRLSFGTLGIGEFQALSVARPSRAVAEIEEELWAYAHLWFLGWRASVATGRMSR